MSYSTFAYIRLMYMFSKATYLLIVLQWSKFSVHPMASPMVYDDVQNTLQGALSECSIFRGVLFGPYCL